ncbi:MAG: hypothetical protein NTZ38_02180 [Candidatus Taylorbacteria bacterium]|nr:hypothetical protein [Candidatus Taylorbacteria bacterium]
MVSFDGSEGDQASKAELIDLVNKGLVSTLGDGSQKSIIHSKVTENKEGGAETESYSVKFVSKNFLGTIQNDNLADGKLNETWLKNPIPETNHLEVNGFANSWSIDTDKLCQNNKCSRNNDGTYNIELVLEYWPQRLFDIGFILSAFFALISLVGYAGLRRLRKAGKIIR